MMALIGVMKGHMVMKVISLGWSVSELKLMMC